ncbi:unnamed protein product, partial [Amoebophrya sp. A25]
VFAESPFASDTEPQDPIFVDGRKDESGMQQRTDSTTRLASSGQAFGMPSMKISMRSNPPLLSRQGSAISPLGASVNLRFRDQGTVPASGAPSVNIPSRDEPTTAPASLLSRQGTAIPPFGASVNLPFRDQSTVPAFGAPSANIPVPAFGASVNYSSRSRSLPRGTTSPAPPLGASLVLSGSPRGNNGSRSNHEYASSRATFCSSPGAQRARQRSSRDSSLTRSIRRSQGLREATLAMIEEKVRLKSQGLDE